MGLLQDPLKALEQAEWYLDQDTEKFPGALELAAGNLCRQILEQILFILCFFSEMPRNRFFRADRTLQTAGRLIKELDKLDPTANMTYWELARRRGPRIRKFARFPRVLRAWQSELNEPSHFTTKFRRIDKTWLRNFINRVRKYFNDKDKHLIVAAINELLSNGRIQATLSSDTDNTPGVSSKVVVGPGNLERDEHGNLALRGPQEGMFIISDLDVPRGPWPRKLVLVQHSVGISIGCQFITKSGDPVDISSIEGVLRSMGKTAGQRRAITRKLRELGYDITWSSQGRN